MLLLIFGLTAFIGLHLIPYLAVDFRAKAFEKIGKAKYRGLFSLAVLASLAAIIFGWRAMEPTFLYTPPSWGFHATPLFVAIGFLLFIASNAPTNIRRMIRHPQMTGILLWSTGHLLSNGEVRSALLFGSFALWAIVAIMLSNRRDIVWIKPDKQSVVKDIVTVVIAVVAFGAFVHFHEAIIGVRPFP